MTLHNVGRSCPIMESTMIKLDVKHPNASRIKEIEDWYMDGLVTREEAIERIINLMRKSN